MDLVSESDTWSTTLRGSSQPQIVQTRQAGTRPMMLPVRQCAPSPDKCSGCAGCDCQPGRTDMTIVLMIDLARRRCRAGSSCSDLAPCSDKLARTRCWTAETVDSSAALHQAWGWQCISFACCSRLCISAPVVPQGAVDFEPQALTAWCRRAASGCCLGQIASVWTCTSPWLLRSCWSGCRVALAISLTIPLQLVVPMSQDSGRAF